MAIVQSVPTSFKSELLTGVHDFTTTTGDTFKIALYSSDASLGPSTTVYSTTNEISGTGYTAGGATLTNVTPTATGSTAFLDFDDASWTTATFTARGALIYNSTNGNKAVLVLDFGTDKTVTAGTFTVRFPAADAAEAIIRVA